MSMIRERVISWLSQPQTEGISAEFIEKVKELEAKHEGLQLAHRKLLERVMEIELREKYRVVSSTKGPPPGMENLRPAYRSRQSLIKEAQGIVDADAATKRKEVDEKGVVRA